MYCWGKPEHTDFTTTLPHSPSDIDVRAEGPHQDFTVKMWYIFHSPAVLCSYR